MRGAAIFLASILGGFVIAAGMFPSREDPVVVDLVWAVTAIAIASALIAIAPWRNS